MLLTQLGTKAAAPLLGAGTYGVRHPMDAWGHMDGWGHMGWGHMGGWGAGSLLVFSLLLLLLVAAVVAVTVALTRLARPDRNADADGQAADDRARTILAERYARGEIGTEEYRERLHELR